MIRAALDVPALGAGALRDGALVALGATGTRRRGGDTPVTTDDLWHLGSCTKAMTATLLAIIAEREASASGRTPAENGTMALRFEATLGDLLPAEHFPMHASWRSVTLSQLLQHRAGLARDFPAPIWRAMWTATDDDGARHQAVLDLLATAPARAPGSPMVYSNAGYVIAGVVAEHRLGQTWEQAMRRLLFTPLGITSAGFGAPGIADPESQPWGHASDAGHAPVPPGRGADNPPSLGPAGTVHMSMRDWAKFIALHTGRATASAPLPDLEGSRSQGRPRATPSEEASFLLSQEMLARLHDPEDDEMALGWVVVERPWAGGRAITHSGSNTMWYATVWAAPAKGIAVFAVCNQGGDDAARACDRAVASMLPHALRAQTTSGSASTPDAKK
ncbi:MAG: serine hydrolase domain-containing protein [Planctomycetota bacterium]